MEIYFRKSQEKNIPAFVFLPLPAVGSPPVNRYIKILSVFFSIHIPWFARFAKNLHKHLQLPSAFQKLTHGRNF